MEGAKPVLSAKLYLLCDYNKLNPSNVRRTGFAELKLVLSYLLGSTIIAQYDLQTKAIPTMNLIAPS